MQYAFHFDTSRCASCHACEVACKSIHELRPSVQEAPGSTGPRYRQVVEAKDNTSIYDPVQYVSIACMHCGSPNCMDVCPAKAIYRDEEFGVILVDQDKCIGCRYCSWACDFGAPQFGADGLMQKCDMCIDRLREGKEPRCAEACCGGAITAAPVEEIETGVRAKVAKRLIDSTKPNMFIANVR